MRVLVTGANGFIGGAVRRAMRRHGVEVHEITHRVQAVSNGGCSHTLDLFDVPMRRALLRKIRPTNLVHLAWVTDHGRYWHSPENGGWERTSLGLLDDFVDIAGTHAFVAGSCAEYDWHTGAALSCATTSLRPSTAYGAAKAGLWRAASTLADQRGFKLAWGRIAFPFGPGEAEGRLVPSLVQSLLQERPARCGPGHVARDFIPVDDVADAIAHLCCQGYAGAVDICSGQCTTVGAIAEKLGKLTGRSDLLHIGALAARPHEPTVLPIDGSSLRATGWLPRVGLDEGLRRSVEWWKARMAATTIGVPA